MNGTKRRDLTIVPITTENCLVIACDSCGAVGIKDGDVYKLPPYYTGKFAARVAFTEVMCSGALPVVITNGVSGEMYPTGEETIKGIQEELENAGLTDIILSGSTEENFPTSMTALATTVVGIAKENDLRFKQAAIGDKLILISSPKVGTEVDIEGKGLYPEIVRLLSMPGVKEIVPVGSKGVAYEVKTLASLSNRQAVLYETGIDYEKSAGPATCLVVLSEETVPFGTVIGEIT